MLTKSVEIPMYRFMCQNVSLSHHPFSILNPRFSILTLHPPSSAKALSDGGILASVAAPPPPPSSILYPLSSILALATSLSIMPDRLAYKLKSSREKCEKRGSLHGPHHQALPHLSQAKARLDNCSLAYSTRMARHDADRSRLHSSSPQGKNCGDPSQTYKMLTC